MENDCKNCSMCKDEHDDVQKRRQIQVTYNSGGYSITITSDYKNEDMDYLKTKIEELIKQLDKGN